MILGFSLGKKKGPNVPSIAQTLDLHFLIISSLVKTSKQNSAVVLYI
jgi:hypothetical protein